MATASQLLKQKNQGGVYSVSPDAPVLDAIREMAQRGVGALLVMQGPKLLGVLSERDYARKIILKGRSSSETKVSQIMSSPVLTVQPEQSVNECMRLMTDNRVRHLPVVEGERVVGVLSIGDLVRAVVEEQARTIEQLEQYIHS
jgi:CBS domain-containing protein